MLPPGRAVDRRLAAASVLDAQNAGVGARTTLFLLVEQHADIAVLSDRIASLEARLATLVRACGSTLTEEVGIGVVGRGGAAR